MKSEEKSFLLGDNFMISNIVLY